MAALGVAAWEQRAHRRADQLAVAFALDQRDEFARIAGDEVLDLAEHLIGAVHDVPADEIRGARDALGLRDGDAGRGDTLRLGGCRRLRRR